MANSNTLEIIQGLSQAAANAYDGVHDERFSLDGQARQVGLRREEGCPIMDSRVIDGFSVKFYGDRVCINYQSDIRLREVHAGGFEDEINRIVELINDPADYAKRLPALTEARNLVLNKYNIWDTINEVVTTGKSTWGDF